MRIAIVGAGIAGLAAANRLAPHVATTLFEAGDHFGGHAHTANVTLPGEGGLVTHGVDTGFLVLNERTYPTLLALFTELEVVTAPSDMSFSVQVPRVHGANPLEWSGSSLASVFAQRRNLVSPRFLGMLADLLRFNRVCTRPRRARSVRWRSHWAIFSPRTAWARRSGTGICCPCWAASGAARQTRCSSSPWRP